MTLIKKTLWGLNIVTIILSIVYSTLIFTSSTFEADYLIYGLLYFGVFIHLTTFIIVLDYAPDRVQVQLRALFFILISLLFLIYTLTVADDPRLTSHITVFLNIITIGIAGSFIMNNSNVLQVFSYKSIIHFIYWFLMLTIAFTFLFTIGNPIWISIINWLLVLVTAVIFIGIIFIPPANPKD